MITLEQFLNSIYIEAKCIDIYSWNPQIWDNDDFWGFCDYPDKEFILGEIGDAKNYIVKGIEVMETFDTTTQLRIEIQKPI